MYKNGENVKIGITFKLNILDSDFHRLHTGSRQIVKLH